ncbi:putative mitochondrial methylcrotonoyl-coa carboxylase biotinylated subunitprotein-like protein [Trypanosoma cruzi]|uniref:3-methylcrotonyl-CoA carboxylase, putative n=1 Tax=Trypanosoma cruzi (strain CL Brener) TaxID=353153 RepID=Q4CS16_TRYCC|nr:3-methylcrotonyl-CoA carboxylase, putative [Trypanosoma cruzi]EAN83068.1 3-methylcrotonyl-CoA carboxylase, putative [Trypanosoma cruzi]RNC59265.1 putative mitochondrial methylcrotonoyl-coa carboxylase biotinylated subunitprotein-like protein [Trypanosoma cruzi]|eukprot:XP_804919.1 3-methylcrotonyl-CoA carboxylase [Trypanosoma cruzi strain CL Brener]
MLRRTRFCHAEFKKILVANRGEIACRVFRTCREMGLLTVAVCCESELNARHVQEADEAFVLGPSPASLSYLRGERIIEAAKRLCADAVHPGYGFLSESPEFAAAVAEAGIEFIGPPAAAMASMGSKSESKRIMEAAGVPVVPGYYGEDQSFECLCEEAKKIGFPVLIKAVSGGGGKGMKIVKSVDEFKLMLESAKRESMNFFKDDRVILERYVTQPRHIECQIFFDKFGNGVFFFERDCSVQRRHQKVIEEAPAPHITPDMRHRIGTVSLRAAKAVGYVGAGTVEFIFDTERNTFFFMEMNTRLQVEHPVTEEICQIKGKPLDLVRLQLETAQGNPLGFTQEDISIYGACVEARIYAESPANGFLPGSGKLKYIREPPQGIHRGTRVRVDSGFRSGDDVLVHYDPMIAKLVVWGENRSKALEGMHTALDKYHIVGVQTNVEFLKRCLKNSSFIEGGVTTNFIEKNRTELLRTKPLRNPVLALGAVSFLNYYGSAASAFRLNHTLFQRVPFLVDGRRVTVQVSVSHDGYFLCDVDGSRCGVKVEHWKPINTGTVEFSVRMDDGCRFDCTSVITGKAIAMVLPEELYILNLHSLSEDFGNASLQEAGSARVVSPMPGKVAKLLVPNGAKVKQGEAILMLEAMKMEHFVRATCEGELEFFVRDGDTVGGEHLLANIIPPSTS